MSIYRLIARALLGSTCEREFGVDILPVSQQKRRGKFLRSCLLLNVEVASSAMEKKMSRKALEKFVRPELDVSY